MCSGTRPQLHIKPFMQYRKKLIALLLLVVLLSVVQYALPNSMGMVRFYNNYIFQPYQWFRNLIFGSVFFSVGDILYLLGGLAIIIAVCRWIYFIARFPTHKNYLGNSLLNTVIILATVYLLFFIGWGGNYYKEKLPDYWRLKEVPMRDDSALVAFDYFLTQKLNGLAPSYRPISFAEVDKRAQRYYQQYTDSYTKHGTHSKASAFGYFMQYFEIQGYYNPWTGEAQVNRFLPEFMLPFVICHEMAHQSGIAAEDDANLLSYALCTISDDSAFRYSGYFNLWLYTHGRVKMVDTMLAKSIESGLNAITLSQRDTLRKIRRSYRSEAGKWSSNMYDGYLRLYNQKNGIASYFQVALTAWAYEQRRKWEPDKIIHIP